ncbi:MAG: hypothetical protein ACI4SH_05690 [Candidatus Scatosoma sp.]
MKFIVWLFDFSRRHHGDGVRYERGGTALRVFVLILLSAFAALVLWLERWSVSLFTQNPLAGFFAIALFACVALATLDNCILYAYLGLSRAARGSLDKFLEKREKKKRGETLQSGSENAASPDTPASAKAKVPASLDAFVGIFSALLAVALLAGVILYFFR